MSLSFLQAFETRGDAPALVFPGSRVVSYGELAGRIARRAADLGPGRRLVAIEAGNCEHAIVTYLAALSAGHAVALLPPERPAVVDGFCHDFQPETLCRMAGGRWRVEAEARAEHGPLHPDLCLLLSTSGSTGVSKGVRLSAMAVEANAQAIAAYLGLISADCGLLALPLHYSYGLSVLNSHLAVGASLFVPAGGVLDAGYAEALAAHGVTNIAGVPFHYDLFERIGLRDHPLPALRFMTVAGGRLAPEQVMRYRRHMQARGGRFFVMYGQTEATARIAYMPPEQLSGHEDCIGIAIPGGSLSLVAPDGREIDGTGVPGELVYAGANVMMGYAAGRADLALGPLLDRLKTGDLAERTGDGFYRIVGRLNRFSKIAGLRIAHDALEQAFAREGLAVAITGTDDRLTAFFATAEPEPEVRAMLARLSGLPLFHLAARRIAALPRMASGKIDYAALAEAPPAEEPTGGDIRDAFRRAFFPKRVGDGDSFSALGGDSLRFVELSLRLEKLLGSLPEGWERMSVAALEHCRQTCDAALRPEMPDNKAREHFPVSAGSGNAPAARKPRSAALPRIGIDMLLRVVAILLVVIHHETLWPIPGGAALMLLLVGWSLARFQRDNIAKGDWRAVLRPLTPVLLPYAGLLLAYALVWGRIPWASVFLLGNLGLADPERQSMLPYLYWFVEIYAQILLIAAGLCLLPRVRALVAKNPFAAGLFALGVAVAARFALPLVIDLGNRQIFTLYWNLHLVVFGWCAFTARGRWAKALVIGLAAAMCLVLDALDGVWIGTTIKYAIVFAGLVALVGLPPLPVPRRVVGWLLPLAASSYHIYLFHRFVPELLMAPLSGLPPAVFQLLAIGGGIAAGLLARALQRLLVDYASRLRLLPLSLPGGRRAVELR